MTGNFKEFKVDSHATGTWDEQNATAVRISLPRESFFPFGKRILTVGLNDFNGT